MNCQTPSKNSPDNRLQSTSRWLLLTAALILTLLTACGKPDQPTIGLYLAIHRGDIDQIERHIAWGTDINSMDAEGRLPLHDAAVKGEHVIAKLLIEHGAKINARDRDGHTPTYHAIITGRTQVAELMNKMGAEIEADRLLDAVIRERVQDRDIIPLLLRWGADINHRDSDGNTPLIQAVSDQQRVLAKFLIANGADVNSVNNRGERPLDIANRLQNGDIIRLLQRNGALPAENGKG